ncbi:MAG TPA: RNA-binding cell elongation regulator Jag/EloR [Candidatus Limnocylindria bacterium]|nr:RNA-binding cell elongation regulator Jag/EloR [Candidatus Limnocylindria bacterium]
MTFREFTGKNVEEAIRSAMKEFSADLSDLDIEILSQGKRGMLGVGGEEARILAAPKSAIAAAETVRAEAPAEAPAERPARPAARGRGRGRSVTPDEVPAEAPSAAEPVGSEPAEEATPSPAAEVGEDAPAEAPFAAASDEASLGEDRGERRTRGGRGRGGRGRNGREREYAGREAREPRESREHREPREARGDRPGREPAPFVSGAPVEELSEAERSTLETAKTVLEEMLDLMGLKGTVEIASGGETARLNVKGEDLGALIGRRGEKLASLQHIVNLIVGRREGQHHRIAVDVENYRGRREEQLRDVAERAAKRVIQTGKIIQLEAMPAVERRIVHMALVDNPKVRTQSVGVEPNRRIVVLPATQAR